MSIFIMILLLCFLILVHEAGHFIAARALGIKVSKFAIGFPIGPTLWSKKIGDVEYLIHACLLGGYVAFPDDEKDSGLPMDSKERFINNPVWKRVIVIAAGVFTNAVVAFLLIFLTAGIWGELPSGKANVYINKITAPKAESVWKSGMQKGDKIESINGSNIESSYALTLYAKNSASYNGKVSPDFYEKNIEKLQKLNPKVDSGTFIEKGTKIILPQNIIEPELKIDDIYLKGYTAYRDNQISLSDPQIVLRNKIKNQKEYIADGTTTLNDLAIAISDTLRPLNIIVSRNGKQVKLNTIYPNSKGLIGVLLDSEIISIPTKTFSSIIKEGSNYIIKQTANQIYGLSQLVTGKIPAKEMHGIVAVAKVGGDAIKKGGMYYGLILTATISAWLAILNFLPIPALDGGHFMFLIIEKLRGKPVNQEAIDNVSNIFFLLLIILALLLIFNDIYALLKHQL